MSKHTPGPWVSVESVIECPFPAGVSMAVQRADMPYDAVGRICEMVGQGNGKYEPAVTNANARLIAAAPELLVLAQMVIEAYDDSGDWKSVHREALAVIEKATGENPDRQAALTQLIEEAQADGDYDK